jgi:hypothetical protein
MQLKESDENLFHIDLFVQLLIKRNVAVNFYFKAFFHLKDHINPVV